MASDDGETESEGIVIWTLIYCSFLKFAFALAIYALFIHCTIYL